MRKRALLTLFFATIPFAANAAILWNQPPTSQEGWFSDGITTAGSQWYEQATADNFTLTADSTITRITFWGSSEFWDPGLGFPDLTNFISWDISIMNTSFTELFYADAPKASLTPVPTGLSNGNGGFEYRFTFNTNINLAAGSYWLHVGSVNDDPDGDAFIWSTGVDDQTSVSNFFDGTGWQLFTETTDSAFRIEGTEVVPEPATFAAMAAGLAVLLRKRRK